MHDAATIVTELYLRRRVLGLTHKETVLKLADHYADGGGLDVMTLVRWEHRRRQPRGCHAQALQSYHGVDSIAELGLGHTPEAAAYWTWATATEIEAEVERRRAAQMLAKEDQVDRRTAVETLAAGLGTALLPVEPLVQAAQLLGGRPSIGLGAVQAAEQVATHLTAEYLANLNDEVTRAAIAHARTLTDRLKHASMTLEVRPRLAAAASDAACLVAGITQCAGRMAEANAWHAQAIALAREAGDRRFEALALVQQAWAPRYLLGSGDRAQSLEALQAAAALDRHLPATARAYVHGVLMRELAAARNDLDSGRALEQVLEAAALASREEPGWGYWSGYGELSRWDGPRLAAFAGLRPLYLSRYRDAIPLFESALAGTSVPVRRAIVDAALTEASAGLGERDQTCSAAIAALDEADPHGFRFIRDEIRALRAGFPSSWQGSAALTELDERLAAA